VAPFARNSQVVRLSGSFTRTEAEPSSPVTIIGQNPATSTKFSRRTGSTSASVAAGSPHARSLSLNFVSSASPVPRRTRRSRSFARSSGGPASPPLYPGPLPGPPPPPPGSPPAGGGGGAALGRGAGAAPPAAPLPPPPTERRAR